MEMTALPAPPSLRVGEFGAPLLTEMLDSVAGYRAIFCRGCFPAVDPCISVCAACAACGHLSAESGRERVTTYLRDVARGGAAGLSRTATIADSGRVDSRGTVSKYTD